MRLTKEAKQRNEALLLAIRKAKRGQFGLTGVKVEMEIVFNRNQVPAKYSTVSCGHCDYNGLMACTACSGHGVIENEGSDWINMPCEDCNRTGRVCCTYCEGKSGDHIDWTDNKFLHDRVLEKLVPLGLAKKVKRNTYAYSHNYAPTGALVFSKVYSDVTVDCEMTFTLSLEDEQVALLLPKFLEIFYGLKKQIGKQTNVANAGMHLSLLNSPNAEYPYGNTDSTSIRYKNFRKSMILLMPALYFLASCNGKTRGLKYRIPDVSTMHRVAISYGGGALEFRVFDTCYDHPEMVLDHLMVALNCLRFWTRKYTRNHLQQITKRTAFGREGSDELARLYVTSEHIDLLNRGLKMIKPSWYTIKQVKQQRNFTVTKKQTNNLSKQHAVQVRKEYGLYEKRFGWEQVMLKNNYIAEYINDVVLQPMRQAPSADVPTEDIDERAEIYAKERMSRAIKDTFEVFQKREMPRVAKSGDYELCVE